MISLLLAKTIVGSAVVVVLTFLSILFWFTAPLTQYRWRSRGASVAMALGGFFTASHVQISDGWLIALVAFSFIYYVLSQEI